MHNTLTNLLPQERQRLLTREYLFRLGVVVATLCIILVLAAGLLLVPTYVFLTGNASAKEKHLLDIKSTLASADEVVLSARLAALSSDATTLLALASKQSPSSMLRAVLGVSRPGIALTGFIFTPAKDGTPTTLALSGIAATRDALRGYQLALQGAPFARSAELPVSAYAKDANIVFTITLTLAP